MMKIEKENGTIYSDSGETLLTRGLEKSMFLNSLSDSERDPIVSNPPYSTFRLAELDCDFIYLVRWHGEVLTSVQIAKKNPGTSWANWTEHGERQLLEFYIELLKGLLGEGPWVYHWGKVDANFDPRSGGASIIVTYYPRTATSHV